MGLGFTEVVAMGPLTAASPAPLGLGVPRPAARGPGDGGADSCLAHGRRVEAEVGAPYWGSTRAVLGWY